MVQLNADIAHIEMRAEQMILHLRSASASADGDQFRADLLDMLKRLVAHKSRRDGFESELAGT